ncbi:MAG: FecR family protein, partial [Bacteroidales bacterium]|nr:FecR family protein [Bacteroidales bacterium]
NYSVPDKRSKEAIWAELSKKIEDNDRKRKINLLFLLKVAAVAVLLITGSLYFWFQDTTVKTNFAQTEEITLPDGSQVLLQAGSEISFNERSWFKNRHVHLQGEAYFSVKKGSKFQVISENGKVQVLGTKFNVISRNEHFEVACVTGKVRVEINTHEQGQILTKGLYTKKINNTLIEPTPIDINLITERQKGKFAFNKAKLNDVFAEIERQFDVKIKYKGKKERLFTGYFSNKDLDKALQMVCIPMELDYQIKNKLVILNDLAKSTN